MPRCRASRRAQAWSSAIARRVVSVVRPGACRRAARRAAQCRGHWLRPAVQRRPCIRRRRCAWPYSWSRRRVSSAGTLGVLIVRRRRCSSIACISVTRSSATRDRRVPLARLMPMALTARGGGTRVAGGRCQPAAATRAVAMRGPLPERRALARAAAQRSANSDGDRMDGVAREPDPRAVLSRRCSTRGSRWPPEQRTEVETAGPRRCAGNRTSARRSRIPIYVTRSRIVLGHRRRSSLPWSPCSLVRPSCALNLRQPA